MDKVDYNQEIKQAQYNGSLIQVGDELNIQITGYDELAIKPFNINTISNSNVKDASDATAVQSYIVNKQGEITMPVLGNIPVTGKTIDEVKVDLEERLKKYEAQASELEAQRLLKEAEEAAQEAEEARLREEQNPEPPTEAEMPEAAPQPDYYPSPGTRYPTGVPIPLPAPMPRPR